MRMDFRVWLACVCLCSLALPLSAATAVSPKLGGTWAGSASGRNYRDNNNSNDTSPLVSPAAAAVTATVTQTGTDLIVDMMITPSDGGPFPMTLTGKIGDFAFWAQGTFTDTDGTAEQAFMSGHFTAKGTKLTGEMVIAGGNNITQVTYKMTRTSAAALSRAMQAFAPADAKAQQSTDPPFNVIGKASGSTYTYATSAKAVKYTASVTGTFVPAANSATLTLTTASGAQTFELSYMDTDYALAMTGQSGSDRMVVFLKTGQNSGSGTAWIYDDTRMIEVKVTAKQQ
jgi:hypothetical protein